MRAPLLLVLTTLLALRTDAVPHSNAFTKRSLMLHRRHRALNGRDHSLIRRENVGEKYSDFCDDRNLNKFQWQKKGMGAQLKLESNLFYAGSACGDGPYGAFGTHSFFRSMAEQVPGYKGKYDCHEDDCDMQLNTCDTNGDDGMWLFFMRAISNYANWIHRVRTGITDGTSTASDELSVMVNKFSSKPKDTPNAMLAAFIITSAILGGISAVLGPVSPLWSVSIALAGGFGGLGVGIINTAKTNGGAMLVQEQLDRDANLTERVIKAHDGIMDALNEWSTTLLENPPVPENNPYTNTWYSNSDKSLPHILNDGDFADTPGSTISDDVSKTMRKHFRPGALAYIWSRENAFIVKISRKVEDKAPCDFDLSNWGIDEVYCDGGTAYFFTTPFDTSNLSKRTMDAPAGYKSLSDYDMTPEILIRSSIVAQETSGYFKQWTLEESLDFFSTETDMPIEMFNAPICDLDKVKNWDNNKGMGYSYKNTELRQNIKFCVDQKDQNGVEWPYQWNKFLW